MSAPLSAESMIFPTLAPPLSPAATSEDLVGEGKACGRATSVDLQERLPDTIQDRKHIEAYVIALCDLIGMKRYGECQIVHFGEGRVAGYSMIQLIETSLISRHFANDTNRAYLDIFSCKGYDPKIVEAFSKQFFGARTSTSSMTFRY